MVEAQIIYFILLTNIGSYLGSNRDNLGSNLGSRAANLGSE